MASKVGSLGVLLFVVGACGGDPTAPEDARFPTTGTAILAAGNPGKDEDPSVLRAHDGSLYVAWFSDRTGTGDIYVTRTEEGAEWSAPVRVTTDLGGDFAPSLIQDSGGEFHLVWFRWTAPFLGHIWYNRSPDGLTWDPETEVRVTDEVGVDDWVPTVAEAPDGSLVVYFASARRIESDGVTDLYMARLGPLAGLWGDARRVVGLNSGAEHDHLPNVARIGDHLGIVWVRYDTSEALPWLNRKSHVYYATSPDGEVWTTPHAVTTDTGSVVNLFPGLYLEAGSRWRVNWLSTRSGDPVLYDRRVSEGGGASGGAALVEGAGNGYSHRVVWTGSGRVHLGVWVAGPEGSQDLEYRFFRR